MFVEALSQKVAGPLFVKFPRMFAKEEPPKFALPVLWKFPEMFAEEEPEKVAGPLLMKFPWILAEEEPEKFAFPVELKSPAMIAVEEPSSMKGCSLTRPPATVKEVFVSKTDWLVEIGPLKPEACQTHISPMKTQEMFAPEGRVLKKGGRTMGQLVQLDTFTGQLLVVRLRTGVTVEKQGEYEGSLMMEDQMREDESVEANAGQKVEDGTRIAEV